MLNDGLLTLTIRSVRWPSETMVPEPQRATGLPNSVSPEYHARASYFLLHMYEDEEHFMVLGANESGSFDWYCFRKMSG